MIIVKIFSGLGNNMFQYAFGKALSLKFNRELIIDKSYFDKEYFPFHMYDYFPYKLCNYIGIKSPSITKSMIKYTRLVGRKRIYKLSNLILSGRKFPYYMYQRDFSFGKLEKHDTVYLNGYWQKFNIIDEYRSQILNDFSYTNSLSSRNEKYLEKIKNCNSVSIQVRKGDYLNHPLFKGIYSDCPLDYFKEGMSLITKKESNSVFFIFSNDNSWVKKKFENSKNVIIVDNDGPDYEHLYLMSQCKHNIISNSTFGWWGAWLNLNEEKIVVAPENWFENDKRKGDVYYPSGWIRISN